jgi:selenide,water dikinase
MSRIKLTQFATGGGCGCKVPPDLLNEIIEHDQEGLIDQNLLVGNESKDDASAYKIENGKIVLSTTDFFMPVVDDPFEFGRVSATNAISDIYAMGGTPLMAIAILAWPIEILSTKIAKEVLRGARSICTEAKISLAGGHTIMAKEPIFGLAVTGIVDIDKIKRNNTATVNCKLFITKPIGVGVLVNAEKKGLLNRKDSDILIKSMTQLNNVGEKIAEISSVKAMTDVTGFGLLGHLYEMCSSSGLSATINYKNIEQFPNISYYMDLGCVPGGTSRNQKCFKEFVTPLTKEQENVLFDPQTSGGLLIAVESEYAQEVAAILLKYDLLFSEIGHLKYHTKGPMIEVIT